MALQNFPTELLDSILSYYDPFPDDPVLTSNCFCELRLVCRAFRRSATPLAFRRVRLCEFKREAFERIVNLSQSSEIARYVISFEYKVVEHISPPEIHHVDSLIQLDDDITPTDSAAIARDIVARHQVYLAQADVLGTYFDILSLSRALPAFSNLRTITISAFASEPYRQYDAGPTRAFWGIIKALNHCTYDITTLTIDAWNPPSLFPSVCFYEPNHPNQNSDPKPQQIASVVGNITHLTLSNIPQVYYGHLWQECIRVDLLRHCTAVESLLISINSEPTVYANPLESFPSFGGILFEQWPVADTTGIYLVLPKLRHLELAATTVDGAYLGDPLRFLIDHTRTLKTMVWRNFWLNSRSHPLRNRWVPSRLVAMLEGLEDWKVEGGRVLQGGTVVFADKFI